jgi:hypothetical protein
VAWTTLLVGGTGAFALLFVVVFLLLVWSQIRNLRLEPPRIRGLPEGEEPRYLALITEPAQRRFEELGFRRAGYLATQPIVAAEPEIVQLVMRNDETHTLAYFHVRSPFTEARPSTVSFESFLADGRVFGTRERFISMVGAPLPNRRRSPATDDQGVYHDHLAALARSGVTTMELPGTFAGLVALNVDDAARIWQSRLDQGVVVSEGGGGFRFAAWASLASIPRLLADQVRSAMLERSATPVGPGTRSGRRRACSGDPAISRRARPPQEGSRSGERQPVQDEPQSNGGAVGGHGHRLHLRLAVSQPSAALARLGGCP